MSRRKSLDNDVEFILAIFVGGTAYAHRKVLDKTVHYIGLTIFALIASLLIYLAIRYSFKLKPRKHPSNISMDDVDKMSGIEFEHFVADLLKKQGYTKVRLTEKYDYGVDIIAFKDGLTWGVQVKRHSGLVKANAVRQVVTGLKIYNCDRAMVITNSYFSKVAIKLAKSNNCILINRDAIVRNLASKIVF